MWRGGRLARVPAARADIFRDRGLGPADKRALMRFLMAAADALRGAGPLHVRHTPWPVLTNAYGTCLLGVAMQLIASVTSAPPPQALSWCVTFPRRGCISYARPRTYLCLVP